MRFPQPRFRLTPLAALVALAAGCHSGGADFVAPASPEAAVRSFLSAVKANSMTAMSELWGSERGPARQWMAPNDSMRIDMERRLTVMRIYLEHDRYEMLAHSDATVDQPGHRNVEVRIFRRGCSPVVLITTVRAGSGWLVSAVDLVAAGNPALPCRAKPAGQ